MTRRNFGWFGRYLNSGRYFTLFRFFNFLFSLIHRQLLRYSRGGQCSRRRYGGSSAQREIAYRRGGSTNGYYPMRCRPYRTIYVGPNYFNVFNASTISGVRSREGRSSSRAGDGQCSGCNVRFSSGQWNNRVVSQSSPFNFCGIFGSGRASGRGSGRNKRSSNG